MNPASSPAPNPALIFGILHAFQESAALKAAIDLGVFTAIADGAGTAAEIAAKCAASERGTRILCDTLVSVGLLEKSGMAYSNGLNASVFLVKSSPAYMGGTAEFLCMPEMVNAAIMG